MRLSIQSPIKVYVGACRKRGGHVDDFFGPGKVWDSDAWIFDLDVGKELKRHLIKVGLIRYMQLWQEVSQDRFQRGLAGTKESKKSFSNFIGAFHGKGDLEKINAGKRQTFWYTNDPESLYKYAWPFPESGIQVARQVARESKKSK